MSKVTKVNVYMKSGHLIPVSGGDLTWEWEDGFLDISDGFEKYETVALFASGGWERLEIVDRVLTPEFEEDAPPNEEAA